MEYAITKNKVPLCKPEMLLLKLPMPVPSFVLLSKMDGFSLVLQQTPRAVIVPPPSFVMFPPLMAVVAVTEVTSMVVMVDSIASLVADN